MVIQLGQNNWILISLSFLEILFIIIPPFIASKIEKNKIKDQLIDIGFHRLRKPLSIKFYEIYSGVIFSILFYAIGAYILFFFFNLSTTLFGQEFVETGQGGAISTSPIEPNYLQLTIIIIQHVIIISICEEAFFRSFLIKKLKNKFKIYACILISSLCFAIYHVPPFLVPLETTVTYFGYYFTFGVMLSCIFVLYKESLLPGIIAHGFFNILIIIL